LFGTRILWTPIYHVYIQLFNLTLQGWGKLSNHKKASLLTYLTDHIDTQTTIE